MATSTAEVPSRIARPSSRPAALPTDRTGLYEFGMGMKSAACWFAGMVAAPMRFNHK